MNPGEYPSSGGYSEASVGRRFWIHTSNGHSRTVFSAGCMRRHADGARLCTRADIKPTMPRWIVHKPYTSACCAIISSGKKVGERPRRTIIGFECGSIRSRYSTIESLRGIAGTRSAPWPPRRYRQNRCLMRGFVTPRPRRIRLAMIPLGRSAQASMQKTRVKHQPTGHRTEHQTDSEPESPGIFFPDRLVLVVFHVILHP
jgi:hypothetical protein